MRTHLIHRPARDIIPPLGGIRVSFYWIRCCTVFMLLLLPSLIGHSGSSAFRLSTTTVSMSLTGSCFSSESAPGALPSWDSRTRWNNLLGDLAVRRTVGPSGHANSPHPSSREGHH